MYQTAKEEDYHDGQVILEEGSHGDWIYVIVSGAVELSKKIGQEKVVIEALKEGDIFGELEFIARIPRTTTARAVGATTVALIDNDFLLRELNKLSGDFKTIVTTMALRLQKTMEAVAQLRLSGRHSRVRKVLSLAYKSGEEFREAYTANVSKRGLFIRTAKPLPRGERFVLHLRLPSARDAIEIGCVVSWARTPSDDPSQPPGMGVEFMQISNADLQKIDRELMRPDSDF